MAPEVSLLEFRYFDGFDWFDSWDSALYGELPKAVEIALEFTLQVSSTQQAQAQKNKLSRADISRGIAHVHTGIMNCQRHRQPTYTMTIRVVVAPGGFVASAKRAGSFKRTYVETCVIANVMQARFVKTDSRLPRAEAGLPGRCRCAPRS